MASPSKAMERPLHEASEANDAVHNLGWSGITYDVKKKVSKFTRLDPVLAMDDDGHWRPALVDNVYSGSIQVTFDDDDHGTPVQLPMTSVKSTGKKRILKGVNGEVQRGRLCAIMGPSGAGKSSLLNILAGRVASGAGKQVGGDVTLDGRPVDPVRFRNQVAYVMQDDALFATQTPREALAFSCELRNPELSAQQREEQVESMLRKLRLTKCADTFVGNAMVRGVSGGEKKRTAIGVELVSNPSYLFLDEPTSGLDSYAAWMVVDMLRKLANGEYDGKERVVVATIHQPSSEVFQLFDDVVLINQGRTVFAGPRTEMIPHFEQAGHAIEAGYNPADHVMFVMQLEGEEGGADAEAGTRKLLADVWAAREVTPEQLPRRNSALIRDSMSFSPLGKEARASLPTQFTLLAVRDARAIIRDKHALIARFGTTIFINLIVALVFRDVGEKWDNEQEWRNHFGAMGQLAIGGMFGLAQPLLLSFPLERTVFLREYASGAYGAVPYLVSKFLTEIPMTIAQSTVMYLVTFWIIGMSGNFVYLVLATSLMGLVAASTALIIGAAASEPQVAIQLSPLLFVPQILFAGFFIPSGDIPKMVRWSQYLCSLKYGTNLITIAEFRDKCTGPCYEVIFRNQDINPDHEWIYVAIMVGVFSLFRLTALLILAYKGKHLAN